LIHLYKFESSTSLSQYRAFDCQSGQIKEINVVRIDEKRPSSKLEIYLKQINRYGEKDEEEIEQSEKDGTDVESDHNRKLQKRGSVANQDLISKFFAKRMTLKQSADKEKEKSAAPQSLMALANAIKLGA
jgi:hypothetical protein